MTTILSKYNKIAILNENLDKTYNTKYEYRVYKNHTFRLYGISRGVKEGEEVKIGKVERAVEAMRVSP